MTTKERGKKRERDCDEEEVDRKRLRMKRESGQLHFYPYEWTKYACGNLSSSDFFKIEFERLQQAEDRCPDETAVIRARDDTIFVLVSTRGDGNEVHPLYYDKRTKSARAFEELEDNQRVDESAENVGTLTNMVYALAKMETALYNTKESASRIEEID